MTMKTRPTTRFTHLSLRVVALLALCGSSLAQQVAPGTSPLSPTTDTTTSDSDGNNSSALQLNQRSSLTASQITSILQQRPELTVELKSVVADQLQQQGTQIQADSISDEMLLSQISTNAQLRASITVWLRARGYVSAAEMDRLLSSAGSEDDAEQSPFASSSSSLSSSLPSSLPSRTSLDGLALSGGDRTQIGSMSAAGLPSASEDTDSPMRTRGLGASRRRSVAPPDIRPRSVTDEPETLHQPAPYNLQSLRDLYSQVPPDSSKLKRFGSEVFVNR